MHGRYGRGDERSTQKELPPNLGGRRKIFLRIRREQASDSCDGIGSEWLKATHLRRNAG